MIGSVEVTATGENSVCLFVCCLLLRSLAVNSKVVSLVQNKPRRLDLLLPLDLHSHVNYILVRPTAELARARVSRWYSVFILQSHSLKTKTALDK